MENFKSFQVWNKAQNLTDEFKGDCPDYSLERAVVGIVNVIQTLITMPEDTSKPFMARAILQRLGMEYDFISKKAPLVESELNGLVSRLVDNQNL